MKSRFFKLYILSLLIAFLFTGRAYAFFIDDNSQFPRDRSFSPNRSSIADGLTKSSGGPSSKKHEKYKKDELLVKFKSGVSEEKKKDLHKKHGSKKIKEFTSLRIHHVKLKKEVSIGEAIKLYKADPDVEYAEPNYSFNALNTPNDPGFSQLWGMQTMNAPAAWDMTTGGSNVVVAVIDTGIDYTHQDLATNIWRNPGEIEDNGLDDDGNGYVDDIYGIDTYNYDSNPFDDHGHGTHVSGTIGAVGNNGIGVVGVNWNVKIIGCKFLNSGGSGYTDGAVECLQYIKGLKDSGVNIIATNNSWGGGGYSQALYDAIDAQREILFIAAAGNNYADNDTYDAFPANYDLPNLLSIAATDSNDSKASFSDYGRHTVDVGAPGVNIYSTLPAQNYWGITGGYGQLDGTSMATPHVTGLAALIKAQNTGRDWRAIKNLILSGGDNVSSMNGNTITGKRINAYGSLACSNSPVFSILQYPSSLTAGVPVTLSVLSINCQSSAGPVTVTIATGEIITLHDDGIAPDLAEGDGIFTGTWTPSRPGERLTFASPSGTETITVPLLTISRHLPEGNTHIPYSYFLEAKGGLPPYTWSFLSGSLPPGLLFNSSTGEISGTPSATGTFDFTVQAQDSLQSVSSGTVSINVSSGLMAQKWQKTFDGGSDDYATGIARDGNGSVYVIGYSFNGENYDFKTVKYDASGNEIWIRTYDNGSHDVPRDIAVDKYDNIYVTGYYYYGLDYNYDFLTLKYDSSGNLLWAKARSSGKDAWATGIATDSNGFVYVSGTMETYTESYENIVTIKYTPSGDELWAKIYDGPNNSGLSSVDMAEGLAVDREGDVYVTGEIATADPSHGGMIYFDRLLLKYDPSGTLLWSRTYSAEEDSDTSSKVVTDSDGNIYTSGVSQIKDTWAGRYFLLLKYDSSGNLLWNRKYDQVMFNDYGANLEVDVQDNIYMAVTKLVEHVGYYYRAVKYDTSGTMKWSRDFSAGMDDHAMGLVVDEGGDIYLTGSSGYQGSMYDFFTVKYGEYLSIITPALPDGAVGMAYNRTMASHGGAIPLLWSISSGVLPPGLALNSSTGEISGVPTTAGGYGFTVQLTDAVSITVSSDFSITITSVGITTPSTLPPGAVGNAYAQTLTAGNGTLPYSWSITSGSLPNGLTLNSSTGRISGTPSAGGLFNFTAHVRDANALTAVKAISISIFGIQTSLLVPGAVGAQYIQILAAVGGTAPYTWSIMTGGLPPGLSLNSSTGEISGVPLVGGSYDFIVRATDAGSLTLTKLLTIRVPVFVPEWHKTYDEALHNYARAIAVDGDGNVFVTGDSSTGSYYYDQYRSTIKYDSSGNVVWNKKYDTGLYGTTYGIALDAGGNVYIGGEALDSHGSQDYAAIKYNSSGIVQWTRTYDGAGQESDIAYGIAGDINGNVYLSGTSFNGSIYECRIIKYDSSGTVLWSTGPAGDDNFSSRIAVDRNGNAYVSGIDSVHSSYVTIKYDPSGNVIWTKTFRRGGGTWDYEPYGIAVDGDGNSYLAGNINGAFNGDCLIVKYDTNGNLIWSQTYDSGKEDYANSVAVDGNGNIYVAGYSSDGTNMDYLTLQLDPAGNLIMAKTFDGGGDDRAEGIALDGNGNVYVTGYSYNGTKYQYLTIKYNQAPVLLSSALPSGLTGAVYSQALTAAGGRGPYTWSIFSGSLPDGLSLSLSGVISGTPSIAGTYNFTVQVMDSNSTTATKNFSIVVYNPLSITTSSLPSAIVGTSYSETLSAAAGLTPYTWSITTGRLPDGLSLNSSTGEISGAPKTVSTFTFIVRVKDANGSSATMQFSIPITGPACSTHLIMNALTPGGFDTFQSAYNAAINGDTIRGVASGYTENLNFNLDIAVTLKGGYDCDFTGNAWNSSIKGTLTISGGSVTVEHIVLE